MALVLVVVCQRLASNAVWKWDCAVG